MLKQNQEGESKEETKEEDTGMKALTLQLWKFDYNKELQRHFKGAKISGNRDKEREMQEMQQF